MLHNQSKDLCKVQDGPMSFNAAKHEKFIDLVSDSTLQLTFKKLLFVKFSCVSREECPQLSEKTIIILPSFYILYEPGFPL